MTASQLYNRIYTLVRQIPPSRVTTCAASPRCTARTAGFAIAALPAGHDVPRQHEVADVLHRQDHAVGAVEPAGPAESVEPPQLVRDPADRLHGAVLADRAGDGQALVDGEVGELAGGALDPVGQRVGAWGHDALQEVIRVGGLVIRPGTPPDPNAHHHAGTTRMHPDPREGEAQNVFHFGLGQAF